MEKQVFIARQFALEEREYTTSNGERKVMASKGFVLTDGIDVFYAEMTGNQARECGELDMQLLYHVQTEMRCTCWETQDHRKAYQTRVYINRIRPVTVTGKEVRQ